MKASATALGAGVSQASWIFSVLGLLGLAGYFVPGSLGYRDGGALLSGGITLGFGLLLRTAFGKLLTGYRSLLLPGVALAIASVSETVGLMPEATVGPSFVAIYLWIGRWHPPGAGYRFAPVAIAAYLLPYAFGGHNEDGSMAAGAMVVALAVACGEILARQTYRAEQALQHQLAALKALALASRTDDLTGLGNRRLGNWMLECLDHGDGLLLLDLDHFKAVNDQFGHTRGDQLLHEFGEFVQLHVREPQTAARMGGEEFLIVLKQTTPETALAVASRLVSDWARTRPLATVSAGVAFHRPPKEPSQTYTDADDALYAAKAVGRNRAVLADALGTSRASALAQHAAAMPSARKPAP